MITEDDIPSEIRDRLGDNNREIVGKLVKEVIGASHEGEACICIEPSFGKALDDLIDFNYKKIYNNCKVRKYKRHAERELTELFDQLTDDYKTSNGFTDSVDPKEPNVHQTLKEFIESVEYSKGTPKEQIIIDFIAGMTDNYVNRVIGELFMPQAIV